MTDQLDQLALLPLAEQLALCGPPEDHDDRATTLEVFEPLSQRFGGFTVDVAAAAHNTKVPGNYFTVADDGLVQAWTGRVWCNPPYSNPAPWVAKAWRETAAELIVMLLPANRTDQDWFQDLLEMPRRRGLVDVEFLRGRIRFLRPGQTQIGPNERPPFGCCLAIWDRR